MKVCKLRHTPKGSVPQLYSCSARAIYLQCDILLYTSPKARYAKSRYTAFAVLISTNIISQKTKDFISLLPYGKNIAAIAVCNIVNKRQKAPLVLLYSFQRPDAGCQSFATLKNYYNQRVAFRNFEFLILNFAFKKLPMGSFFTL